MHIFAFQRHDLNLKQQVDMVTCAEEEAKVKLREQADSMGPGFLSLWCWHPKEGWQYVAGYYRITTSGKVRASRLPGAPPEDLHPLPGEGSALEFQPEQFPS